MSYLKALGIFRLVAEQKDKDARAWWQSDSISFLCSTLDRDRLIEFFLNELPAHTHCITLERW